MHVGGVRTALFNWAFARHFGGTLVLRVEDTDTARSTQESMQNLLDSLSWLGLNPDEGPVQGGAYGPYVQSERSEIHTDVVARLLAADLAYRCFCTRAEIEEREQARPKGVPSGYDGHCRHLDAEVISTNLNEELAFVIRMRVRDDTIAFDDLVRGEVSFEGTHVPDYVIVRANGEPLYTLVNPVDDSLMQITHVLRGEDLLPSTPRQIVMYEALATIGVGTGRQPRFGHLPLVMGEGNRRLAKRDKGAGLLEYQQQGYLPEGLLNYLALLGWAISEDRDVFGPDEMAAVFDIRRVNPNPARFDPKKCEAINAAHIRALPSAELTTRLMPYLVDAQLVVDPPTPADRDLLVAATPLIQERMNTLAAGATLVAFLFTADADLQIGEDAGLKPDSLPVLEAAAEALAGLEIFDHPSIEAALRSALIERLGLKPRHAFGPVRAAISGSRISPPLFESIELLGRDSALTRIAGAKAHIGPAA